MGWGGGGSSSGQADAVVTGVGGWQPGGVRACNLEVFPGRGATWRRACVGGVRKSDDCKVQGGFRVAMYRRVRVETGGGGAGGGGGGGGGRVSSRVITVSCIQMVRRTYGNHTRRGGGRGRVGKPPLSIYPCLTPEGRRTTWDYSAVAVPLLYLGFPVSASPHTRTRLEGESPDVAFAYVPLPTTFTFRATIVYKPRELPSRTLVATVYTCIQ